MENGGNQSTEGSGTPPLTRRHGPGQGHIQTEQSQDQALRTLYTQGTENWRLTSPYLELGKALISQAARRTPMLISSWNNSDTGLISHRAGRAPDRPEQERAAKDQQRASRPITDRQEQRRPSSP